MREPSDGSRATAPLESHDLCQPTDHRLSPARWGLHPGLRTPTSGTGDIPGNDAGGSPDAVSTVDSGSPYPRCRSGRGRRWFPPSRPAPMAPPPPPARRAGRSTAACGGPSTDTATPDFGPNVLIFDPSMSMSRIQSQLDGVYAQQDAAQFGTGRYAYFFKPGSTASTSRSASTRRCSASARRPTTSPSPAPCASKADWLGEQQRDLQLLARRREPRRRRRRRPSTATSTSGPSRRARSCAACTCRATIALDDDGGWSSGGFIADSLIDGQINSGSQQQFLTRNDDQTLARARNWNMVFVGDGQPPSGELAEPAVHRRRGHAASCARSRSSTSTPRGNYLVMVPGAEDEQHRATAGRRRAPPGVAAVDRPLLPRAARDGHRGDASTPRSPPGKHLLLTPGHLPPRAQPRRSRSRARSSSASGSPTLIPDNGNADPHRRRRRRRHARRASSSRRARRARRRCLQLGAAGSTARPRGEPDRRSSTCTAASAAPTPGTAASCVTVNSNDVILDNIWLWRADHGAGAGWTANTSNNGIIVNGDDVTAYGLFVEHFQQYQTLWNGNGGAVYFYQSEMPYDPPNQAAWMEAPGAQRLSVVQGRRQRHDAHGRGARRLQRLRQRGHAPTNAIETPTASGHLDAPHGHRIARGRLDHAHHQRHRRQRRQRDDDVVLEQLRTGPFPDSFPHVRGPRARRAGGGGGLTRGKASPGSHGLALRDPRRRSRATRTSSSRWPTTSTR